MIHNNSELMQVLVDAKQEQLRQSAGQSFNHEPGATRRWMGSVLIRLGERIGGGRRVPVQPTGIKTLATQ